jgi:hypothetical protein
MRSLLLTSITVSLLATIPARAELRVCNSLPSEVKLALVWVNPADAKIQDVPFTTQGWWSTAPGQCSNINVDGVLMYYRVEGGEYDIGRLKMPSFAWPQPPDAEKYKFRKFGVPSGSFRYLSTSGPPAKSSTDEYFQKFGAFPVYGKGHWLLVTLQVSIAGVAESCVATSGSGASLETKC